ncbi:TIGR03757 family integrating conjugative element protein [Pasteurella multocida]|uniref:TIGR03757 family integrating conjugative element protein n=1 Tax=Pasteurella multocida TaxID=747 RepID=UPI0029A92C74|nr:TIGR03757 family integrating conjugative element protein [Pasteurella multocida]MDX3903956.1 TIGR03757 family integrating conjugative element protein [Pasteurella multocida]MDX3983532.1 TIGR03757 family integrating conjugative element protein [Pasteurella multocida]
MKASRFLGYFSIVTVVFSAVAQAQPNIIVYTTKMYPIQNSQLASQIYYLDQVENFEEEISRNLSKSPEIAEQEIRAFFNSADWKAQEQQLKDAYQGVISGWQNGIKKVPAVFFDNPESSASVIYGTTDVKKALDEWHKWVQRQGESK